MFIVELLVIFQNLHIDIGKQVYIWILNFGVHVMSILVHICTMKSFCMYTSMYIYEKRTSIHRCTCESLYKRTTICVCIFECYLNLQMLYNLQMYVIYLYGLHEENHLGLLLQEIIIIVEPETRDVSFHVHMNRCTCG